MPAQILSFSLVQNARDRIKSIVAEQDSVFNQLEFYTNLGETTARLFYTLAKDISERSAQEKEFLDDIARELSNSLEVAADDGHPVVFRFL